MGFSPSAANSGGLKAILKRACESYFSQALILATAPRVSRPQRQRVWQNFLAGTVILSAAKNLAYAGLSARFFAATKIGKSLAYASGYYFHRLWVARSAMSNCAQNDESDALAITSCHTLAANTLAANRLVAFRPSR